MNELDFEDLRGLTLTNVVVNDSDIIFTLNTGDKYRLYHETECCEDVYIEDICGDIEDIINSPIVVAEESTNEHATAESDYTWTFYKLDTIRGGITIRWFGQSNGYYSTGVSFEKC